MGTRYLNTSPPIRAPAAGTSLTGGSIAGPSPCPDSTTDLLNYVPSCDHHRLSGSGCRCSLRRMGSSTMEADEMSELVPSSSGIPEKAYDDPGASEVPAVRDGSGSLEP